MRHKLTVLLACACAFAAGGSVSTLQADPGSEPEPTTTTTTEEPPASAVDVARVRRAIRRYRSETWRWQRVIGLPLTRELASASADPQQRLAKWRRLALTTRRRAQNPPHRRAWLCIQRYEAGWHDPSAPYYGGLQMDLHFQRTYGGGLLRRKGTADHWTPLEQMWAAERAHRSGRGFYPWPNTARYCGLM
jgi:hypothetical protein